MANPEAPHPTAATRPGVDSAALFTGGLAWLAHVALDRALGYGLRGRDGFQRG
jgi:Domain of unknown function (DUF4260)